MARVDITLYVGETGDINFTVKNDDGTAYDLTGATVTFYMYTHEGAVKVDGGSCTIVNATAGECKYGLQAADTDTEGMFLGFLKIVKTGETRKTRDLKIQVQRLY